MSVMRALLSLLLLSLLSSPSAAGAVLAAPVAQCINDNAARVEMAISDLNQAVDFLVTDICAEPVAAEQARQSKLAMQQQTAHWQKTCSDMEANRKAKAPDSETAASYDAWCSNVRVGFLSEPDSDSENGYTLFSSLTREPAAVALASRLLLDLRLSRTKRQQ